MYPELFKIPIVNITVKSYGVMMVIGFASAVLLIERLTRDITTGRQLISNVALYSLLAGVAGARIFYVLHYIDRFRGNWLSIFALWQGGLELLGGVIFAIAVIILYLRHQRLPVRRYLDVLAVGLMLALAFGRIGCFLNGCCFGKPAELPWAVRFPYGSFAYRSQIYPDQQRNRSRPQLRLPGEFFGYVDENGIYRQALIPYERLTPGQKQYLKESDKLRSLPVHPTELYSSANAAIICMILYWFYRRSQSDAASTKRFARPGTTFSMMFLFYGVARFGIEYLRGDNPFEIGSLTISQLVSAAMVIIGIVLLVVFHRIRFDRASPGR